MIDIQARPLEPRIRENTRRDDRYVRDVLATYSQLTTLSFREDYVYFLKTYGQSHCLRKSYLLGRPLPDPFVGATFFAGADDHFPNSIARGYRELYEMNGRPPGLLPIAADNADGIFAFSLPDLPGEEPRVVWIDPYWQTVPDEEVNRRQAILREEGIKSFSMSREAILISWEMLHPETIDHEPGWGNIHDVAPTFGDFLERLVIE